MFNGRKIPINEVVSQISEDTPLYKSGYFDGAEVNLGMLNMRLFATKGCDCVHCDLKGEFFRVERMGRGNSIFNEWHLNLYGVNEHGREVMMTKDHIHAKSKGGVDELRNLQTMCEKCNVKKQDMPMDEFQRKFKQPVSIDAGKYSSNLTKVTNRMLLRYGINIDRKMFDDMNRLVKSGRIIRDLGGNKSIREITVSNKLIKVFYNAADRCIISVMEDKPDEWFFDEMVPSFARHDEARAKILYKEIKETAAAQLKILETPADTARYIQSCTYPPVMFCMWKSPDSPHRLSMHIWSQVHKLFKSLESRHEDAVISYDDILIGDADE